MNAKTKEAATFFKDNLLWFVGLGMAIINLWLATKLSPLTEGILVINQRVQAIEQTTNSCITRTEFTLVEQRLDRIQNSLNDLIKLHLGN